MATRMPLPDLAATWTLRLPRIGPVVTATSVETFLFRRNAM
jgi:hypothetical protein